MKIKQTISIKVGVFLLVGAFLSIFVTLPARANDGFSAADKAAATKYCKNAGYSGGSLQACGTGYLNPTSSSACKNYSGKQKTACQKGQNANTQGVNPTPAPTSGTPEDGCSTSILPSSFCSSNGVWQILTLVVNVLAAGIGLVAVGGFIYAAILYATAEDNASQVTKAKMMMFNITIGLVAFALMYGFLQFLIPGGVFG